MVQNLRQLVQTRPPRPWAAVNKTQAKATPTRDTFVISLSPYGVALILLPHHKPPPFVSLCGLYYKPTFFLSVPERNRPVNAWCSGLGLQSGFWLELLLVASKMHGTWHTVSILHKFPHECALAAIPVMHSYTE